MLCAESIDYIAKDPHLELLIANLEDADRRRETRRMLVGRDSRLNLLSGLDDSLQTVLTQTILSQEEDFKNQVLELHRLYEIQKIMMKELHMKVSDGERAYPFFGPYTKNLKYETLATERKFTEVHTICSSVHVKNHCLQEHRGTSDHKQIPLNLQFPANHYTNDTEDLLFDCVATEFSAAKKQGFYNDKVPSSEVLQLSLKADPDTWQKGSGQETCKDKAIHSSLHQSIRFEGSACDGSKHDFESSTSSQSGKSDAFDWNSKSHSLTDGTPNILERQYLYQGAEKCQEDISCKNISTRRTLFTSPEVRELDLNKAPMDDYESSVVPFGQWIPDRSNCTSSVISYNEVSGYGKGTSFTVLDWRKPKNNSSTDSSSALDRQDMTNSTLTTSPSKEMVAESETSLTDKSCQKISLPGKNGQKNKEDKHYSHSLNQELVEGTDSNRSPTSCKSDSITDDVAPSSRPSDPKGEKLKEVDKTVRAGAVSLVYLLSSEYSKRNDQDSVMESKKRKEWCNDEREASESSSESFESIVLREQECSVDEYCVSSSAPLLDEKDGRIKLRRGRRMKDFRKEILPNLASLSRQEICEDIKIMELAIRSREYKKYRSKTVTKSQCVSSVRAKRSRRR